MSLSRTNPELQLRNMMFGCSKKENLMTSACVNTSWLYLKLTRKSNRLWSKSHRVKSKNWTIKQHNHRV